MFIFSRRKWFHWLSELFRWVIGPFLEGHIAVESFFQWLSITDKIPFTSIIHANNQLALKRWLFVCFIVCVRNKSFSDYFCQNTTIMRNLHIWWRTSSKTFLLRFKESQVIGKKCEQLMFLQTTDTLVVHVTDYSLTCSHTHDFDVVAIPSIY